MFTKTLELTEVEKYIRENIGHQFHSKKIAKVNAITLDAIVRRKNPYLFKAKGSNSAHDFIKSVLDATLSSGEETNFGDFIEGVAIFVAEKVFSGRKSGIRGLDLEFEDGSKRYLVTIKSGPNWGNSGQKANLVANFITAKKTIATSGGASGLEIICIEGCCYGVDNTPNKGTHLKLCGQRFWEFVSGGNSELFRELIEPIGHQAQLQREELTTLCEEKLNTITAEFVARFCDGGAINWDRLVRFNSGKN